MPKRFSTVSSLNAASTQATQAVTPTNCDLEPIRIPGQIQPHGLLLVLSSNLDILQVSQNVDALLGLSHQALLGQALNNVVEEPLCQSVRQAIQNKEIDPLDRRLSEPIVFSSVCFSPKIAQIAQNANQTREAIAPISSITASAVSSSDTDGWYAQLHLQADAIILELISPAIAVAAAGGVSDRPLSPTTQEPTQDLYAQLAQRISHFQSADSLSALAEQIVQAVADLTQFDRVMVYQFATDYSGTVIAEAKSAQTDDSFLGLRYPATDIPMQARELYLQSWMRVIPQVDYEPVSLVPERHPISQQPLDLSAAELRSVSPMHVEYLQNMGVSASMSISLIVENRLWGLIACHHNQPKRVRPQVRNACEFLGQMASLELFRQQTIAEKRYLANVRNIQYQIRQTLTQSSPNHAIGSVLSQHKEDLLALVRATGVAIVLEGQLTLIGKTPSAKRIRFLVDRLVQSRQDVYHTHALPQDFDAFESEQDCACGLLAISIFLNQVSYHVMWFRPELVQSVTWAGNPSKPSQVREDGSLYLTPRQSFERWREAVHGQSVPWQISEVGAAQELRSTLLLTALRFSQVALQQAASEAQVANLAKSQFLAKMSHELRTPLNAILGFTQLIHYQEDLSHKQRDRLNIINRSGEHLLSLINDILETSRIEANQLRLNETCFDLHQFIASVRDMLTLRATNKGLLLEIKQHEVPQYVWGDESKLRQIVLNLVGNAIKFTERGEVTLSVSCLSTADATGDLETVCLQFEVDDTGLGIEVKNLETIFEPFKQAEAGRQAYEGTGLGLSISRQNARLMGGDIEVRSQVNCGSTFTCRVRLEERTATDYLTLPSRHLRRVVALADDDISYRILVVEDVAENQQLLVSLLTTVGFEVKTAANGQAATDIWRQWRPHCIWMDLYMPEMDGYAATRQIRSEQLKIAPEQPPVIIAISASVLDRFHSDLSSSGFDDYVSKPFQVNEIFEKMARHMGVRYQYANEAPINPVLADSQPQLSADPAFIEELRSQLKAQPSDWTDAFYPAALGAREQQVQQLIAQLPKGPLAEVLQSCLEQLRFDVIRQIAVP